MNRDYRGVLVGMILGDSCLQRVDSKRYNSTCYVLSTKHSKAQQEYAGYKAALLTSIFGGKKVNVHEIDNNGYPGVCFSKTNKYLRILYKRLYLNKVKTITSQTLNWLTPKGLAIWWMDDGSLYMKKRNGKIHAREGILSTYTTLEENQLVVNWAKEKFGIIFSPVKHTVRNKEFYRLRINTTNLPRLITVIKPHMVKSMNYKVDMKYKPSITNNNFSTSVQEPAVAGL